MVLEGLDDILTKALEEAIANPHNKLEDTTIRVITIQNGDKKAVSVYPDSKFIEFHGEYTQTAPFIEELKPLVNLALSSEYETNL